MANSNTLSRLFGKSPFKALQAHMRVVLECAQEVLPLIEALARGDESRVIEAKDRIFEREGIKATSIEGDAFHRYDRADMKAVMAEEG